MKLPPYKFDSVKKQAAAGLLAAGWPKEQVALALGVRRQTIYNALKGDADFASKAKTATEDSVVRVADALYKSALSGNVTAQIFFLCNRDPDSWHNINKSEVSAAMLNKDGQTGVVIQVKYG